MKKIILISLGIVVIGGGILVWLLLFYTPNNSVSKSIRNILPFGSGTDSNPSAADKDTPEEVPAVNTSRDLPRLFRLSEVPVSGAVSFIKNGSEVVRYTDRATGHIYDINPVTLEKVKITNNTLPKIYEAYFKKDGSGVIYRSLTGGDEISNLYLDLVPPKSSSTNPLYGESPTLLRGDIDGLAPSTVNKVAYVLRDQDTIVTSDFNGTNQKIILSSPYIEWILNWDGPDIFATTKPSSAVSGFSYKINPSTGAISKILGPVNGLTTLPNKNGAGILYSSSAQGALRSFFLDLQTGKGVEIIPTILPEKCAWSKKNFSVSVCGSPSNIGSGGEPDLWYQGITHFADSIWKFNFSTNSADALVSPSKDFNTDIDVINPFLTPDEDYLIFMNKDDLSLWALKLL